MTTQFGGGFWAASSELRNKQGLGHWVSHPECPRKRRKKKEEEGGDGSNREIDGGSEDLAVVDTGGFVAPEEKPLVDGGED